MAESTPILLVASFVAALGWSLSNILDEYVDQSLSGDEKIDADGGSE